MKTDVLQAHENNDAHICYHFHRHHSAGIHPNVFCAHLENRAEEDVKSQYFYTGHHISLAQNSGA
jgi:hypothetical protein